MPGSILKAEVRSRIWNLLTQQKIALFPGAFGRTPKFRGVRKAVARLRDLPEWREAERVLVLGEPVLAKVRRAVITDHKTLIVPDLTRTEGWIGELSPRRPSQIQQIAEVAELMGRTGETPPSQVEFQAGQVTHPVDLMIIGAVGIDLQGTRIGKGIGEADLVYGLGRSRGFIQEQMPVMVMVHNLQMLKEPVTRETMDLPVDIIITPDQFQRIEAFHPKPKGLYSSMITTERLDAFPGLRTILTRDEFPLPDENARY